MSSKPIYETIIQKNGKSSAEIIVRKIYPWLPSAQVVDLHYMFNSEIVSRTNVSKFQLFGEK